jgi:methylmalonyl-CoA mutase
VQAWIRTTAAARAEALSRGQAALTGATLHPDLDEAAVRVDSDPFPPERSSDPIRDGWATLQARERPARVNALHVERLAAPYEGLRRKSDAHLAASGSRPVALAVPLGPATAHRFALQWVRHALTLGGFAVQPVTSAKLSTAPSAPVAVLCGSAEVLQTEAAALVPLLRNKGVLRILVTGVALPDIDGVLEPGGDLLATLQALQVVLNLD